MLKIVKLGNKLELKYRQNGCNVPTKYKNVAQNGEKTQ